MNIVVLLALIGGSIARIPAMIIQGKRSDVKVWKVFPLTILLTVVELLGTMILFYVENGFFGGMSYYGGILLMPIFVMPLAFLMRIPYKKVMDMCGVAAGGMLAVMRLQCVYFGCCDGREVSMFGHTFAFPSPIVELTTVLIIMVVLVIVGKKIKLGLMYPTYMIAYGVTRFILNWYRADNSPFVWNLPHGNFWSIIAVLIGVCWIVFDYLYNKNRNTDKGSC
ncbi:MAG: prolipoprotein diacylglyceryl transferase [Clostridia bacterium]|nr:prolipoprotein diacylglyceryl transferase [Clostridia bacterium]